MNTGRTGRSLARISRFIQFQPRAGMYAGKENEDERRMMAGHKLLSVNNFAALKTVHHVVLSALYIRSILYSLL